MQALLFISCSSSSFHLRSSCTPGRTGTEADAAIELATEHGVNHFDVSPLYGQAEVRPGPCLERNRKSIFLACKTTSRGKAKAWDSIKRSLETLRVSDFDLYQLHGVNDLETLNEIYSPVRALAAVVEAKEQGLVRYIGITGHWPSVQVEAFARFDLDTVMFPINRGLVAHPNDFNDFASLVELAR